MFELVDHVGVHGERIRLKALTNVMVPLRRRVLGSQCGPFCDSPNLARVAVHEGVIEST